MRGAFWTAAVFVALYACSGGSLPPPPEVDAGEDRTVFSGETVELTGSATGEEPLSLEWTQISGTTVPLEGANTETARFIAPAVTSARPLVFAFRATTDAGATAIDFVTITIDLRNRPPAVSAGPAQTVTSLERVILTGAAGDEDGEIASLLWRQTGGPSVSLSGVNSETATFLAPAVQESVTLLFVLTATDDQGGTATAETRVSVVPRVIPGNIAPEVDAGPDRSADELETVTLAGTATDADGRIVSLAWTQLSGPPAVLSSTSALSIDFEAPGVVQETELLFELAATDDRGARVADRTTVTVSPLNAPNAPPVADAGADQKVEQGSAVTLAGGGTDPDGQIAEHAWRQLAGPPVGLDATGVPSPSFTAPAAECELLLAFELTVTDNEGATGADTVIVLVNPPAGPSMSPGDVLDFETAGEGAFASGTALWERGPPAGGPGRAHSGLAVWATSLAGAYPNGAQAYLHFPMIDLRSAVEPTLSFRMWLRTGGGDGASLQIHDDLLGWIELPNPLPSYDANQGGIGVWTGHGYRDRYALVAASLSPWVGRQVCVRLAFRSDASGTAAGAYVDAASVFEESDDPDGDGALGVRGEVVLGIDPFRADSDGDGVADGVELDDGTDPLDPAWFLGASVLAPGAHLDFEGSPQGAASDGSLWEHGVPLAGPARASSGSWAWATDLDADYFSGAREHLYLPRIDLRFTSDPTLSFRLWIRTPADSDGISLEIARPGMSWEPLVPERPPQDGLDPLGRPAWSDQGYQSTYVLAAVSLAPWVGDYCRVRIVFRSDAAGEAAGAAIDDVRLHEEGADPDADGIPGVLGEMMSAGTDPFRTDSDGDGTFDGIELVDGTDPSNPAWYEGALVVSPGNGYDFESSEGGLASSGELWEHGVVTSGPLRAHSGSWVWATNASSDYFSGAVEPLYLPRLDLTGATNPTLAFRLWSRTGTGDGTVLEIDDGNGWVPLAPALIAYDGLAGGAPAWSSQGYLDNYVLVAFSLPTLAGAEVSARLVFRSDETGAGAGAFIDDVALYEETADPDADGLAGVITEIRDFGTDPFLDDTDGDGADDGPEITAGTDPLDPAHYPAGPILGIGALLTFDANGGGLAAFGAPAGVPVYGSLWERGVPTTGPGVAFSGTRVWATQLAGGYFDDAREVLHLPPIDLTAAVDPTLSFRLWSSAQPGDGVSLEVYVPSLGWGPLLPVFPLRDGIDAIGRPAWTNQASATNGYVFAAASLQLYTGGIARVRLVFRSNGSGTGDGAYIDDVRLNVEAQDPDGDGLFGVIGEHGDYGTDPYLADTDGDGADDGTEIANGTDPLDPTSP